MQYYRGIRHISGLAEVLTRRCSGVRSLKRFAPLLLPVILAALPLITKLAVVLASHNIGVTGTEIPLDDSPF